MSYISLVKREGDRVSYASIVPCTAVVRVQARSMIFTTCGVIVGSRICIRVVTQRVPRSWKLCRYHMIPHVVNIIDLASTITTAVQGTRYTRVELSLPLYYTLDIMDRKPISNSVNGGPSRSLQLSKLDSQSSRAMWKDSEEKSSAEEVVGQMEKAFETIINCLGDPKPQRDGLRKTPMRAARALCYFTKGYEEDLASM